MAWHMCDVLQAGPAENGKVYVALRSTDGSFYRWFSANTSFNKEMLATALTAIGTAKRVRVNLTSTSAYSTINRMYIQA